MQVALRQFKLRTGSGGSGRWHGGEGVIREVGADCSEEHGLGIGLMTCCNWCCIRCMQSAR